mmetsp:Transcript_11298/g.33505  ORF Transcript_11298/g.33505 Transcript_11298/m.33505 type:complete len:354 (-) Transcript_11298:298-1359(-)|eukprot:CAMPEP_0206055704 /NCGR_PEP_ID=MMETSP1466-20131121/40636_1 /ASSEMBLY_ACC=CAM_ASM_001126 /TAXON_ID=44452 /ORGANISM="Pavlova gyrans, Strain CCMP608" /LENGTH=353 /DNA_ID=CAMNT_0053430935 /DNA_START=33 /DNA_END=1094 /DNA_ORIENTATION=-
MSQQKARPLPSTVDDATPPKPRATGDTVPDSDGNRWSVDVFTRKRLMAVYEETPYPKQGARVKLAADLHVSERQIQVWFQNQRQRRRRRRERATCSGASSQPPAPRAFQTSPTSTHAASVHNYQSETLNTNPLPFHAFRPACPKAGVLSYMPHHLPSPPSYHPPPIPCPAFCVPSGCAPCRGGFQTADHGSSWAQLPATLHAHAASYPFFAASPCAGAQAAQAGPCYPQQQCAGMPEAFSHAHHCPSVPEQCSPCGSWPYQPYPHMATPHGAAPGTLSVVIQRQHMTTAVPTPVHASRGRSIQGAGPGTPSLVLQNQYVTTALPTPINAFGYSSCHKQTMHLGHVAHQQPPPQ